MRRVYVLITGDVIGVGFRSWTVMKAKKLKIVGWVRNTEQQTVEAVLEGTNSDVESMVKACQNGPATSLVQHVTVEEGTVSGEFADFEILR